MGGLGFIDDIVNIQGKTKIKGLSAKLKLLWMF
jgi:UDP-N-acetylmuramyl pentapeptide phosphotransferase/UDP-N-acetylglucosamine-1-phosphate transferase